MHWFFVCLNIHKNEWAEKIEQMSIEELIMAMKSSELSVVDVLHHFQDKVLNDKHY